jgi:hypothetical protein
MDSAPRASDLSRQCLRISAVLSMIYLNAIAKRFAVKLI